MGTYTPPKTALSHYLSLQDAVALGYASYSTLHRWTRDGTLPSVKIGGRVKVLRADLDSLATPRGCASPTPVIHAVRRLFASARPLTPEQRQELRHLIEEVA